MSTEERGGGGGGQGFISGQFCPPLNLPTAEDEQGGHDPPAVAVSSPAAVGSESPPPEIHISPAEAGSPPGVTRGSPLAPVYEQGGRDPPLPLAAAETSLAGSGVAEQEVQQEPPRNPAFRCCDFRFDDKKLWVCAAGVFLVLPFLLVIIHLLVSLFRFFLD